MPNLSRVDPRSLPQLFAWYDAMLINGFGSAQPADAAALAQWNDLSGNARHLVQATGANQPLFRLTGGPSGFPSVNFVDNTDTMQVAIAGTQLRPVTVVAVAKNTVADDASYHMAATFNAQRIGVGLDWTGANNTFIPRDDAAIMAGATVAGDTTTYHVLSFVAQPVGGLSRGGTDGIHVTVAGLAGTNTNLNVDVGTGGTVATAWIGHVCEVIVLTGELGIAITGMLENALAEKWGIVNSYKWAA
jgi:hypothetical protein